MLAPRWLDPRRTFGTRLTIIIVSLLLLTLAAATLVTLRVARASLTDQVGENFQGHAESLSELVQLYLTTNINEVQQLATDQELVNATIERNATYQGTSESILAQLVELDERWAAALDDDPFVQSVLAAPSQEEDPVAHARGDPGNHALSEFHNLFEEHSQVFLTDQYGGTIFSTGRLSDYYQAEEDWWQAAWNNGAGAVYVSNPEYDLSAGVMALLIAVPVVNDAGTLVGILRSTLRIDELYALLESTTLGETGYAALLGTDGTQFFDPGVGTSRALFLLSADMLEHISDSDEGYLVGDGAIFGHEPLAATELAFENATASEAAAADAVGRLGWHVIFRQDASEALSTLNLIERVAWLSGGVAMLIGTVAAMFVGQAVTRPLTKLAAAAHDIGEGNLDTPLPQPGHDEIGGLTGAFHTMTSQLRQTIGTLKKRTDELSRANVSLTQEVEERKRAEDARRESDRRHQWLIESAPDPMLIVDQHGRIVIVNSATEELFGYSRDELLGESVERLLPEQRQAAHASKRKAFVEDPTHRDMASRTEELSGRRKDGSLFPAEISLSPLQTADGMLVTASIRDITERRRAEAALRESEERYRDYYENAPNAYFSLNAETGVVIECNQTAIEMLGVGRSQLIGQSVAKFYTPDSLNVAKETMQLFLSQGYVSGVELRIQSGDGSIIDVSLDATAVRDADGRIVRSRSVWRDITERKRAEKALQASEANFRAFFENVQDIFFQTDSNGVIVEISPSVERYGYTQEGIIGTSVLEIYDDPEQRAEVVRKVSEDGELEDHEIRLRTADGGVIEVSLNAHSRYNAEGEVVGIEGTMRDITDRKRAERELVERKEQLEIHTQEIGYINQHLAETQDALEQSLEAERARARTDSLTGVLNHGAIVEDLRELISSEDDAAPHAIAMVDLDGLKAVNDTFGHQTGDEVLVVVAETLAREGGSVGRYGGDEFVVILRGTDRDGAEAYRARVMAELQTRSVTDLESGATIPVMTSIGMAIYPEEAETVADIIALSDSAMYAVKRHRAVTHGNVAPGREDERTSQMVGQIVPLLTSPGDFSEKINRAAKQLSAANGYDSVEFSFYAPESGTSPSPQIFAQVDEHLLAEWKAEEQRDGSDAYPMRALLERTRRPVMIDDIASDERIPEKRRELLVAAGIKSGLVVPMIWDGRIVGSLGAGSKRPAAFTARDAQYLATVATQITAIMRMETLVNDLRTATEDLGHAQEETVLLLAAAAEAHDHTTGLHLQSVRSLAEALALEMKWSEEDARALGLAAVLHDIGKIRVPDSILASPGKLTPDQWEVMRNHTIWGASFLTGHAGFELATEIARSHHEQWDGTGYPDGLPGSKIPEGATIVSVADAFDAMTHNRPYRSAQPVDEAIKEIVKYAGKQFNPEVVAALQRLNQRTELSLVQPDAPLADAA